MLSTKARPRLAASRLHSHRPFLRARPAARRVPYNGNITVKSYQSDPLPDPSEASISASAKPKADAASVTDAARSSARSASHAVQDAAAGAADNLDQATDAARQSARSASYALQDAAADAVDNVDQATDAARSSARSASSALQGAAADAADDLEEVTDAARLSARSASYALQDAAADAADNLEEAAASTSSALKGAADSLEAAATSTSSALQSVAEDAADTLAAASLSASNALESSVNSAADAVDEGVASAGQLAEDTANLAAAVGDVALQVGQAVGKGVADALPAPPPPPRAPPPRQPVAQKALSAEELKIKLLAAVASLDRGLAANAREARDVDELVQSLEDVGGPVVLSWKAGDGLGSGSAGAPMQLLGGCWRLIYSSAFNGGSLGGRRPGPPAPLAPGLPGQVYQVIDEEKGTLDNIVEFLFKGLPQLPLFLGDYETPTLRLTLGHDYTVSGVNTVTITYERTSAALVGAAALSRLPVLATPSLPEALRPPRGLRSAAFNVTYLDSLVRVTRGDRGELRIYLRDEPLTQSPPEDYVD